MMNFQNINYCAPSSSYQQLDTQLVAYVTYIVHTDFKDIQRWIAQVKTTELFINGLPLSLLST